jgi:hypothetical protein
MTIPISFLIDAMSRTGTAGAASAAGWTSGVFAAVGVTSGVFTAWVGVEAGAASAIISASFAAAFSAFACALAIFAAAFASMLRLTLSATGALVAVLRFSPTIFSLRFSFEICMTERFLFALLAPMLESAIPLAIFLSLLTSC